MFKLNRKAQSTAEYVIVLGLIVAAVVAMQTYVKRGFQGRIKDAVDYVDQTSGNTTLNIFKSGQYEPYYMSTTFESNRDAQQSDVMSTGGGLERTLNHERSYRSGNQIFTNPVNETTDTGG